MQDGHNYQLKNPNPFAGDEEEEVASVAYRLVWGGQAGWTHSVSQAIKFIQFLFFLIANQHRNLNSFLLCVGT